MMRIARLALVVPVTIACLSMLCTPASAHEWTEPATWSNGHTISAGGINQGNLIFMWQMFVSTRYAETRFSGQAPPVTGTSSPTTENYTKFWQAEHNVAHDGIVGPDTWNAARFWHVAPNPTEYGGWRLFKYRDPSGYPGVVSIPYTPTYGTWFVEGCGGSFDRNHITHPQLTLQPWVCD